MIGRVLHQDRVAVGLGAGHDRSADIAVAAALVVDQHLLAEFLAQQVGLEARDQVGAAAWRRRYHHGDRLVGVGALGLGRSGARRADERARGGGEGYEAAASHG